VQHSLTGTRKFGMLRLNPGQPSNDAPIIESGSYRRSWILRALSLIIFGACLLESGCRVDPTVWHMEIPSPDGAWIALADTSQNGGPGNASIATTVSLKGTRSSNAPQLVLGFDCEGPVPRPYTLDNVANAGGTINLKMKWVTPSRLEVTYSGHPDVYLQTAKLWGVDISLRNLSSEATAIPSPSIPSNPN
jgi:hypothetical protein